ncbi:hypothetical protein CMK11_12725 [Candidatus Poribacteria bacterium]|nr:hypothetical protein [Candidatus Poribacteria bacterium]
MRTDVRRTGYARLCLTLAIAVLVVGAQAARSESLVWEPTQGPEGGSLRAIFVTDDGTLLAGGAGGGDFPVD